MTFVFPQLQILMGLRTDANCSATYQGLVDGGPAGLIWSYIWTFFGFVFVVMSLAEMASMAP
jgi:hypothetical protein